MRTMFFRIQRLSDTAFKIPFTDTAFKINPLPHLQPLNQVIIWDKIVTSKEAAWLKLSDEFVKYALIDQGQELRYFLFELQRSLHLTLSAKLISLYIPVVFTETKLFL